MKAKLLITLLVILITAVVPSFAQDQGDPDTLILLTSRPGVGADDSTFTCELWLWNDVDWTVGVGVGFYWVNDNLILTSTENLSGWGFAFLTDGGIANSNATKHFQYVGFTLDTAQALKGSTERKLIGRWNFLLTSWSASDSIFIDTLEYDPGVEYTVEYNDGTGNVSNPNISGSGGIGGVWVKDPSAVIDGMEGLVPATYSLSQNYPNPFNPGTKIDFALPNAGKYKLTIYNVLGQIVTQFEDEVEAGYHQVEWDASDISSGVYFYKLSAGDFADTKKMVFVK